MIIREIRIDSFGSLRNRTVTFTDGLNLVEGKNESGKTAMAAFIKFMLYGLSGTPEAEGEPSERERFINRETGRAAGVMEIEDGAFSYQMSILKSSDGDPSSALRYTFSYEAPAAGEGRFIHTYEGDGSPLPSFAGEPVRVALGAELTGDIDRFADAVWEALNGDNKVSLFVRFIDIADGSAQTRIINKNA